MTFEEILQQTIAILQSRGRVSYRALKRQFNLDDDYLDDLKAELLSAYPQVVDENGHGLAWPGETVAVPTAPATPSSVTGRESVREPHAYTPQHLVEKILTSHAALQGERKQVTVLFCDLANNTGLAEQLGPETMHIVLNQFFELALGAVHRYEGTINQFLGDGFMALFGAPIAHEDHARRAVLAALEFRRQLHAHNADQHGPQGVELTVRMGLNTGMVVVGAIGDNLRMDYTAVGDTTNVAARLEQEAAPNQIVISEATHRLAAGYCTTRPLGTFALKGKTVPVAAWEVVTAREARTRLEVEAERGLTPLVGRARELRMLHDCFAQARTGRGQVVFLVGEAGIGKSRLLLEFRHQLGEGEATWLEGHALSFGQAMAFHPLIDLLKRNFRIEEDDPEGLIIEKIEQGVLRLGDELRPILPYLRYFLAVDPGDAIVRTMDPQLRRAELFAALRRLLVRAAEVRSQVLVFEDLHWVDKATEAFLLAIADSIPSSRVLCLFTYRPGYVQPFGDRTYHTRLALPPLSTQDSVQMAQALLATEQLPVALQTLIIQKAEGNPFFVEEVVKSLQETSAIRLVGAQYVLTKPIEEIVVPDTIQDVLMARIDRLDEEPKQTLQLAAVIGREFPYRLLSRLGDIKEHTEASLQALKAIELIYETSLYPELAYMFKHALTQDVAYNSLLVQRRQELHRTVGYAIEELYADRLAEHYAELAHHFAQGEVWEKAMEYSTLAGDRAAAAYANAEAKAHYVRALEAAAQITLSPEPGVMARLHAKHGAVLMVLGEYEGAVTAYQRALELIKQTEDRRGEIDIRVGLSEVYRRDHREEPAIAAIEQALAMARELGDRACEALCLANRVSIRSSGYGQLVDATPDAGEALRLAREIGDPKLLAEALISLGRLLQWRAVFDGSLVYLHEGSSWRSACMPDT
jgi:class 3 adenylate cyclase/tetratricopeptide (TPR) repeat protein